MLNKTINKNKSMKGILLGGLFRIFAYIPLSLSRVITGSFAWLIYKFNKTSRKVTEVNLKLCYPHLNKQEIDNLTRKSIKSSSHLITEMPRVWLRPNSKTVELIHQVEGLEVLKSATCIPDVGTIILSPHLGNWEVLFPYLLQNYTVSALYRPPKIPELEAIIRAGRQQGGGKIIRTTKMEARKMLKVLKSGELLILLPDQNPQDGSGVYAPFYGIPAYTMTLPQGLVKRTGAKIVLATVIRTDKGYNLHFINVDIDPTMSEEEYSAQMNVHLQQVIDKTPEQYEWAYKRFKKGPEGKTQYYY
ncbi:MAG: lysophospholipid acyltransferase family protein [Gammaproteobacteria bacterium]|nr:lysophospholipid acyltransferase family protein [Gammaproteobacteria bacterium]